MRSEDASSDEGSKGARLGTYSSLRSSCNAKPLVLGMRTGSHKPPSAWSQAGPSGSTPPPQADVPRNTGHPAFPRRL